MKATELERLAQELVDNLNHNVVNQVPSDKQVVHSTEPVSKLPGVSPQ
jgi:hypothetical protein